MGWSTRLVAPMALAAGLGAAVAFADDSPLAPKSVRLEPLGTGAAISYDGSAWEEVVEGYFADGLDLVHDTLVRGPARLYVVAGAWVEVPAGSIVRVSWQPAVRGWRFEAVKGDATASFTNAAIRIVEGSGITLTMLGELYRHPSGYSPGRLIGLTGLPEVSGFRPFEDDQR